MQKKGANISLKGYDDIFSTDQSRAEAQQERVQEIPLSELHPFEGHPFRVVDDEDMMKTVESVRDFGVLTPAIVRPDPDGGYEIISGHRRHRASELAGKETMPVIVRDMDDDAAIILMVDANLQRETILPSERAYAYKMKLDALKHQGARSDLTSAQLGQKSWAVNQVAEQSGDSRVQVQRYIRLFVSFYSCSSFPRKIMRKSTRYIWQIHDLCTCLFCISHGLISSARIVFDTENNQIRTVNHGPISDLMGGLEMLFCGFETDFNFIIILMK